MGGFPMEKGLSRTNQEAPNRKQGEANHMFFLFFLPETPWTTWPGFATCSLFGDDL